MGLSEAGLDSAPSLKTMEAGTSSHATSVQGAIQTATDQEEGEEGKRTRFAALKSLALSVYRIEKLLNPAQDRLLELPKNYLVIGEVAYL